MLVLIICKKQLLVSLDNNANAEQELFLREDDLNRILQGNEDIYI